ncbi:MAG: F0F1 ATP synthase subunit epsilon [Clostridia bacterium]|nr:F0F1 ATP synthase subunit epsilon [Clostridia bacterium]
MNTFRLKISTPDGNVFDGQTAKLDLRGVGGELAVMAGHIPFMTAVKPGVCRVMDGDGSVRRGSSDGGLLNVSADGTTLLVGCFTWDE